VFRYIKWSSKRRRSSIIVKGYDGIIKHFIKGADDEILSRLNQNGHQPFLKSNLELIKEFEKKGLRVFCYGLKVYQPEEVAGIMQGFNAADSGENSEENLDRLQDQIEKDFILLGTTAVEDKIQADVAECIADFRKTHIKVKKFLLIT
jgi:magnesium-transporting ATPase (P-type)